MNTLTISMHACDDDGNWHYYDVVVDLETWKVEVQQPYGKNRYSPVIQIKNVEIFMDHEFLEKKVGTNDDGKKFLDVSKHDLK